MPNEPKPFHQRQTKWYGWRRDNPDPRDRLKLFADARPELYDQPLPPMVSLKDQFGPCYDQGETSSCTANALSGAIEFLQRKDGCAVVSPSRLQIYWNERWKENTTGEDNGAMIRDGVMSLEALGYCRETTWPFDISQILVKPPQTAFDEATAHQITNAFKLVTPRDFKVCLAAGYPFVFGMMIYAEFESDDMARTGVLAMPQPQEQMIGGHAVLCVGYDDNAQTYLVRNSWGDDWGQQGYFTMPQSYLNNPDLCSDYWTLRKSESDVFPS